MLYGLNEANNPRLYERAYVNGASGETVRLSINRPITHIICSVKQGAIDIYFGGEPQGRIVPDYHFGQTNKPEVVPFTGAPGDVYLVASGIGPNVASVFFGGP
jgi:hypothetical protein